MTTKTDSNFDELRWVIQIRRILDQDHDDENEFPISIFNVPKSLKSSNPYYYIPQQVAIGPYHHSCPELYEMERFKLNAAKRTQKQLQIVKFQVLVDQMNKLEPNIRACYHKYLDINGETLAWMMAIDASFLLDFLQTYSINEGKIFTRVSSRMLHNLVDFAGRKSAHNAILRDIIMLENQIPLFTLRKLLEFQFPSLESADEILLSMLMGLCEELSPFRMMENLPKIQVSKITHLLDFVYQMIVPKLQDPSEIIDIEDQNEAEKIMDKPWNSKGLVWIFKRIILSKPVKIMLKLPWKIISNHPIFGVLKRPVDYLFFPQNKKEPKSENDPKNNINKPPLLEEITIPSVTELSESGIQFTPTNGNLSTVTFDVENVTFYLPTISLDVNAEVVLRNLVAYEASNACGPLIFTRYTELINGIIDTKEDVKLLREKGIILNRLKSDEEVANLWNGMSKCIRLTKVVSLDKVIEDVNKFYNGRWKIKLKRFIKFYAFNSCQCLTFLAAILVLLVMTIQIFCSVYGCIHIFRVKTN